MEKNITDILDKHPKAKLVILLGGEAWSSFLHLEDEKYKQLPVFCGGSVAEKGEEKKNGNGDNKSYLFSFI